jgi:hypothetical protein
MIMFKHTLVTVALVAPLMAATPHSSMATGVYYSSQTIENFTRTGEKVGDYEPIDAQQFFAPASACIVDKDANLASKLIQCKKQRIGWLKI